MPENSIAYRVKKIRKGLGLNQSEFGNLFGVTQGAVSQWESGVAPETGILIEMARHGKTTVEWIWIGKEVTPEAIDTEVREVANLVSEKGRREEWLNYGRYLATGEKQITLSPDFKKLLEKVPPNQRPEVISVWIESAKTLEKELRLRGLEMPSDHPRKTSPKKKRNEGAPS